VTESGTRQGGGGLEERLAKLAQVPPTRDSGKGSQTTSGLQGCALSADQSGKKKCASCNSRGYVLENGGASLVANLCVCVTECPTCFGRARIIEAGMSRPCREPHVTRIAALITQAQIPFRYRHASFANFANLGGNGQTCVRQIESWVGDFRAGRIRTGFVLGGPIGVGKSFLLAATTLALAEAGVTVRYCEFFQLLAELRAGYADGKADPTIINPLLDVDVLVIDELGKGRDTEWEKTIADSLISGRYNRGKTVLAATNFKFQDRAGSHQFNINLERDLAARSDFNPEQYGSLERRMGQRVFSRLREMTAFIELTGPDYRAVLGPGNKFT